MYCTPFFPITSSFLYVLSLVASQIHTDQVQFDYKIPVQFPSVLNGDETKVREILINLLNNAVKYTRKGRIEFRIRIEDQTAENITFTMQIADTGIGIPEDQKERIFERFYRVDKSHSREIGGTGLGLSIVKHGAILHNAKIHVDSELGKGTRMELTF